MANLDEKISIIPLSSIAKLLNIKLRTLRMYKEKGLLPQKDNQKRLYSIEDIKWIELIHYLATIQKINVNGIKYILKLCNKSLLDKNILFEEVERTLRVN